MFADWSRQSEIILHGKRSLKISFPHTHTHAQTAKCQLGLLVNKIWHPCCQCLWKACQKRCLADTDEVTWLVDLWAICHPRSDRVRRGRVWDRLRSCVRLLQWILYISCLFTQTWVSCQKSKGRTFFIYLFFFHVWSWHGNQSNDGLCKLTAILRRLRRWLQWDKDKQRNKKMALS